AAASEMDIDGLQRGGEGTANGRRPMMRNNTPASKGTAMNGELEGRKIAIFVGDDYEDLELQYPKYRLIEAGAEVVVAGLEAGVTHKGKHGYPQKAEIAIADLDPDLFDGLVIPGGWMPDKLRRYDEVKTFTKAIDDAGKLVASICHGPWIDISADIV